MENADGSLDGQLERVNKEIELHKRQKELTELRSQPSPFFSAADKIIESPQKYGVFDDVKDEDAAEIYRLAPDLESKKRAQEAANGRLELGEWAEIRLRELRTLTRLVRAGRKPESLRPQLPDLFTEVVDQLQPAKKARLYEEARGRLMTTPDLMERIADVKQLSGATLMDYRKEYRQETGTGRKRHK